MAEAQKMPSMVRLLCWLHPCGRPHMKHRASHSPAQSAQHVDNPQHTCTSCVSSFSIRVDVMRWFAPTRPSRSPQLPSPLPTPAPAQPPALAPPSAAPAAAASAWLAVPQLPLPPPAPLLDLPAAEQPAPVAVGQREGLSDAAPCLPAAAAAAAIDSRRLRVLARSRLTAGGNSIKHHTSEHHRPQ